MPPSAESLRDGVLLVAHGTVEDLDDLPEFLSRIRHGRPSPPELIAETVTAFGDGLAAAHALEPDRDPRPAFDILWLALLTLAE